MTSSDPPADNAAREDDNAASEADKTDIALWEAAYLRFETPEEERAKFLKRLKGLGAATWDRNLRILELCCGRGNGLDAWTALGFSHVDGLDLSADLVAEYRGEARTFVGDARRMPFSGGAYDVVAVQGGLHHLLSMDDLEAALSEVHRVLKPQGRFVIVEPWLTPFLRVVHASCRSSLLRRLWKKLDALATMIEHERTTYQAWLSQPRPILAAIDRAFQTESRQIGWGKLTLVGRKRAA